MGLPADKQELKPKPFKAKKMFFEATKKKKSAPKSIKPPVATKQDAKKVVKVAAKKGGKHPVIKPVKEVKLTSVKYSKHKTPLTVEDEARKAGRLSSSKTNQVAANKGQVDEMKGQSAIKKEFDKEKFGKSLRKEVDRVLKGKKDAEKIKENGKVDESVTKNISKSVGEEKQSTGGHIEATTIAPPDKPQLADGTGTKDEPLPLTAEQPEQKTNTAYRDALAPKPKPAAETDFTKETRELDEQYASNGLSQDKLQSSDEPKFIAADNQKQASQEKARQLTENTRQQEAATIAGTQQSNRNAINNGYNHMLSTQGTARKGRFDKQTQKSLEEAKIREDVKTKLDGIFNYANSWVIYYFAMIDWYIEQVFGAKLLWALEKFSARAAQLLDDHTGFIATVTFDRMSEEEIFNKAKDEFETDMEKPVKELVDNVATNINLANQAIEAGKKEADRFWNSQDTQTKDIAQNVYDDATTKFEELEASVESKQDAVIEKVTEKFEKAMEELDTRFAKAVEENKSWFEKAIDAVKSVINTIIELKNAFVAIARKAATYAGRIIDAPVEFFGNLSDGVGQGFTNFKNNIDKHLVKGVLEWLTGSMAGSDIELPKELNFEGITSLVMQILGISVKKIKALVIDIIGKERFEFIEKGVEASVAAGNQILNIFKILNEKGLLGLWEFIKEEFSNLKEMLIENVKTFVIETITQKAIEFVLSLLIPGAGFIRAAQLLIRFVITLFQKAAQILKIIDGIIDTFGDILDHNLAKAAEKVENVFSNFLSLAISFLAAVLGLNGIVGKVQKFIQTKIRPKIDSVLKNIAKKIKQIVEKIGLTKIIDKSMKVVEKGKKWAEDQKKKAIDKGKAGVRKLLSWLGLKKTFTAVDEQTHSVNIGGKETHPLIIIKSKPKTLDELVEDFKKSAEYKKNPRKYNGRIEKAISLKDRFEAAMLKNDPTANHDKEFETMSNALISYIKDLFVTTKAKDKSSRKFGPEKNGVATLMTADPLVNDNVDGEATSAAQGAYVPLFKRKHEDGNVPYYIQGHLLNHHLGGPNQNTNLTPLKRSTNSEHERIMEKSLKHFYHEKKKLKYVVTPNYGLSVPITDPTPNSHRAKTIKEIKEQEIKSVPLSISIQSSYFMDNGDGTEKEVAIFNGKLTNNVETNDKDYVL